MEKKTPLNISILAIMLWLLTAILGVLTLIFTRELALRIYLSFQPLQAGAARSGLSLVNAVVTMSLAIVAIGILIAGIEFHRTRVGTPESWRMYARTLAFEVGLLSLVLFI
jgi:hypothetical protein